MASLLLSGKPFDLDLLFLCPGGPPIVSFVASPFIYVHCAIIITALHRVAQSFQ